MIPQHPSRGPAVPLCCHPPGPRLPVQEPSWTENVQRRSRPCLWPVGAHAASFLGSEPHGSVTSSASPFPCPVTRMHLSLSLSSASLWTGLGEIFPPPRRVPLASCSPPCRTLSVAWGLCSSKLFAHSVSSSLLDNMTNGCLLWPPEGVDFGFRIIS